jgi:hypothetical protein
VAATRAALTGVPKSLEHRAAMRVPHRLSPRLLAHLATLADAQRGQKLSPARRRAQSMGRIRAQALRLAASL